MADTIIVDIQVSNAEAVKQIEQSTAALSDLKAQEKDLREEREKGNVTNEQYYKKLTDIREEMERNRQTITANKKALKDNIKTEKEQADSLNKMRKELRLMLKEYDALSKAEREGAKGTDLLKKIQNLTGELNEAEQASGRFQRNVGNYGSALNGLTGKLEEFSKNSGFFSKGMNGIVSGAKNLGQSLGMLAKNPFFIILRTVIGLVNVFATQIKRSDEAMTALDKVTAAFKPILDALRKVFDALVSVVTKVATALTGALTAMAKWLGLSQDTVDANQDLVASLDALEETEREYTVNSAKRNAEISELRAKASDREKYTAQERIDMMNRAAELEKQDLRERREIAKEKLRLAKLEAKLNKDTSDETANNLAQLEAAVYQAEQAYNEGMRSIVRETNRAVKEINKEEENLEKERQARAREWAARQKERRSNEISERRAMEDAIMALVEDGIAKEKELLRISYTRSIQDLRERLRTEQNLTKQARKYINEQIILLDARYHAEIAKIDEQARKELQQKREAWAKAMKNKELEAMQQGWQAETLAYQNELAQRLQAAEGNAEEMAFIAQQEANRELTIAQMKKAAIMRENYETTEAYELAMQQATAAVIEAQNNATAAAKATADAVQQTKEQTFQQNMAIADSFNNIAGNMNSLFETLAEGDERYQNYATAMAGVQILVSTAMSVANAIQGATKAAAETGVAAPFTLPSFIAEMVAIVTGAVAQATALLTQAKSQKPTYAEGGYISGPGTGTSDSITARVSNGESVMTAKATAMFYDQLSAMNVAGGGRPFDKRGGRNFANGGVVSTSTLVSARQMRALGDIVAQAVEGIQPVVSVREITNMQNRIRTKEIISKQ